MEDVKYTKEDGKLKVEVTTVQVVHHNLSDLKAERVNFERNMNNRLAELDKLIAEAENLNCD